jgi:hypothetical protein
VQSAKDFAGLNVKQRGEKMKKHVIGIISILCLVAVSWAQENKAAPLSIQKSQDELQAMKDIFSTTINFVIQNAQKPETTASSSLSSGRRGGSGSYYSSGASAINAYLYSHGAAFVFLASNWRLPAVTSGRGGRGGGPGGGPGGVQPPSTQPPPPDSGVDFQKMLRELQDRASKSRQIEDAERAKMEDLFEQVKGYLIEAVANYGDLLTAVKPNKYITLVLVTNSSSDLYGTVALPSSGSPGFRSAGSPPYDVVSIQKSWITDYKSEKLTMGAFRQKALKDQAAPVNTQKSQEELQSMKGIFSTTITAVGQNALRTLMDLSPASSGMSSINYGSSGSSTINAYNIYGQGALFVFASSNWRLPGISTGSMYNLNPGNSAIFSDLMAQLTGRGSLPPSGTVPSAPPAGNEDWKKQLRQEQDRAQQNQRIRERMDVFYKQVKGYLIDAVADYGESLNTVKPNEYITLILLKDSGQSDLSGTNNGSSRYDTISIQKSWITDYKAGRLTADAFKQKVLLYAE